jgi:hypothetical protein
MDILLSLGDNAKLASIQSCRSGTRSGSPGLRADGMVAARAILELNRLGLVKTAGQAGRTGFCRRA